MKEQTNILLSKALKLPAIERAELIENLLASFESAEKRKTIDKRWAEEAESRIEAYETGEISAKSAEDMFSKINNMAADAN